MRNIYRHEMQMSQSQVLKREAPESFLITVDNAHIDQLEKIAHALEALGMADIETYSMSGVIAGTMIPSLATRAWAIPGIETIEQDQNFGIGPA